MASVIKAGNATDGVQVTSDNTGILELKTGTGSGTTAVTIGTDQSVTFAGAVSSSGNQTVTGNLTVNGNTTLGDANTDTILMTAAPSIGGAGLGMGFGFRNRIINGGMVIDQRNAGAAVTANGAFPVDRYQVSNTSDGAYSAQQDSSAPTGFINSVKVTTTTADASLTTTQQLAFRHIIEGLNVADLAWGTASASSVTLSFWVRSSLTGTFGGSLQNSAANRSYVFTYTISAANTWEQKTITVPGDTSGTWLTTNGRGIVIWFGLGVGPSASGTAGSWTASELNSATGATSVIGTLNATWYITGVQLEKGSTATSFDYRPYGTELALCQRYYYRVGPFDSTDRAIGQGGWFSATSGYAMTQFPVTMRTRPTALEQSGTTSNYAVFSASGGGVSVNTVPAFYAYTTTAMGAITFTTASGGTTGATTTLYSNQAAAYLGWSAEL